MDIIEEILHFHQMRTVNTGSANAALAQLEQTIALLQTELERLKAENAEMKELLKEIRIYLASTSPALLKTDAYQKYPKVRALCQAIVTILAKLEETK